MQNEQVICMCCAIIIELFTCSHMISWGVYNMYILCIAYSEVQPLIVLYRGRYQNVIFTDVTAHRSYIISSDMTISHRTDQCCIGMHQGSPEESRNHTTASLRNACLLSANHNPVWSNKVPWSTLLYPWPRILTKITNKWDLIVKDSCSSTALHGLLPYNLISERTKAV